MEICETLDEVEEEVMLTVVEECATGPVATGSELTEPALVVNGLTTQTTAANPTIPASRTMESRVSLFFKLDLSVYIQSYPDAYIISFPKRLLNL
jgi:hypothetical protein